MSWNDDDDENGNTSEDKNENKDDDDDDHDDDDDDETMSQNEKKEIIKGKNDILDKIIDKSKSFEQQRKSLKKLENLKGFWPYEDFGDKELKFKYSKIKIADMSNEIHKNLFK